MEYVTLTTIVILLLFTAFFYFVIKSLGLNEIGEGRYDVEPEVEQPKKKNRVGYISTIGGMYHTTDILLEVGKWYKSENPPFYYCLDMNDVFEFSEYAKYSTKILKIEDLDPNSQHYGKKRMISNSIRVLEVIQPQQLTRYIFDSNGSCYDIPNDRSYWDVDKNMVVTIYPEGKVIGSKYNKNGNLVEEIEIQK